MAWGFSSSTKVMKIKSLINPFNSNDYMNGDKISISIFSDTIGKMFKCGDFTMYKGDMIDFNDL